jgi:hypothetical protein
VISVILESGPIDYRRKNPYAVVQKNISEEQGLLFPFAGYLLTNFAIAGVRGSKIHKPSLHIRS